MPVELTVCETVREADGLAISSRNAYLSLEERARAPILIRALRAAEAALRGGERNAGALRAIMWAVLGAQADAKADYVSASDPETLRELETVGPAGALLSLAVRFGGTRLIDNLVVGGGPT
jgi:pantoate--beta-alanine ligase